MANTDAWLFWALLWVQAGGAASLIAFRLPLGKVASRWCLAGFSVCLALVGFGTLLAVASEAHCWICPAFSLGLLTVGASLGDSVGEEPVGDAIG